MSRHWAERQWRMDGHHFDAVLFGATDQLNLFGDGFDTIIKPEPICVETNQDRRMRGDISSLRSSKIFSNEFFKARKLLRTVIPWADAWRAMYAIRSKVWRFLSRLSLLPQSRAFQTVGHNGVR